MIFELSNLSKTIFLYITRFEIASSLNIEFNSVNYFNNPYDDKETNIFLKNKIGNFVTLNIKDNLRGCIGQIIPNNNLLETLKENAISSAFYDPRFNPLKEEEFNLINIEISLLSKPELIVYEDKFDLLNQIKEFEDGLIIKKNHNSSTFLPQVWQNINGKKDFLNHLCLKAGLEYNVWEQEKIEVKKYNVIYFNEKEMEIIW